MKNNDLAAIAAAALANGATVRKIAPGERAYDEKAIIKAVYSDNIASPIWDEKAAYAAFENEQQAAFASRFGA